MLFILTGLLFIFIIYLIVTILQENLTNENIIEKIILFVSSAIIFGALVCTCMYMSEKETSKTEEYTVTSSKEDVQYSVIEYTTVYKHKINSNIRFILFFETDTPVVTYKVVDQNGDKLEDLKIDY